MHKRIIVTLIGLSLLATTSWASTDYNQGLPIEDEQASVKVETQDVKHEIKVLETKRSSPTRPLELPPSASVRTVGKVISQPIITVSTEENVNRVNILPKNDQEISTVTAQASFSPTSAKMAGLENMSTYGMVGYGSGFFVTPEIIATNWHVVRGYERLDIMHLGVTVKATLIAKDENNDLALLKINSPSISKKVNPLPIIDARKVSVGERVYTVGFPDPKRLGFRPKIADGLINSVAGEQDNPNLYQISTPIQPGNSGSPLINNKGQVVGVVSKRWTTKQYQNVSYAVKSNHLENLLLSLPEGVIIPEEPVFSQPADGADVMLLARDAVVTIVRRQAE